MKNPLRLGINIDHVATLRNARGGAHPCPVRAAELAEQAGADSITLHLREDRRHIRDEDVLAIKQAITIPMNFEMAATAEMQVFALNIKPHAVCIVPEKREERTTEGGLDVVANSAHLKEFIAPLAVGGIRVSLFVAPDDAQIHAAKLVGAQVVELHTGHYAELENSEQVSEALRIQQAATLAHSLGLEVHAGHGLNYNNVASIAAIGEIVELNIGHFLVGEAVFIGLDAVIKAMRTRMDEARA